MSRKSSRLNPPLTRRLHENRLPHNAWLHLPPLAHRQVRWVGGHVRHAASLERHAARATLINMSWAETYAACFDLGGELPKTHGDQSHHKHTPALNISWGSARLLKHVIMKHLTLIDSCCRAPSAAPLNFPNTSTFFSSQYLLHGESWEKDRKSLLPAPLPQKKWCHELHDECFRAANTPPVLFISFIWQVEQQWQMHRTKHWIHESDRIWHNDRRQERLEAFFFFL